MALKMVYVFELLPMRFARVAGVRVLSIIVVLGTALGLGVLGSTLSRCETPKAFEAKSSRIASEKYLLEEAVQCQNCHTPPDEKGDFIKEQWLKGATFLPDTFRKERLTSAETSANIAGLPGWADQQAVKFLMTGLADDDLPARAAMPR